MRKWRIAATALAIALLGGAGAATTWMITPASVDYQVNGWALHCDMSTAIFNICEAVKPFGPATVTIRTRPTAIAAEIDTQCRGRKVDGGEIEWSSSDERIDLIIKRIQDETDRALQSCRQRKLSDSARLDIHTMAVLVYGLRTDR